MFGIDDVAVCTDCVYQDELSSVDSNECPRCGSVLTFRKTD
jgi:predicted Zn-ribbon and HTH transcriptional regulator